MLCITQEIQVQRWASSLPWIQSEQVFSAEVHVCAVSVPGISPPWTRRVARELFFPLLSWSTISPLLSVPQQSKVPYDSSKTLLPCLSLQWPPCFVPAPYFLLNETKSLSFLRGPSWRMTRLSFILFFFFICALIGRTNLTGLGCISPYRLALIFSKTGITFSFPEQSLRKGNCCLPCGHCRDVPDAVPLYFSVLHWEVLSWICFQISLVISVSTSYTRSYY